MLCAKMFNDPESATRRRMFGHYFHALTAHAAMQYRTTALRSLNCGQQERIFQQSEQITTATSSRRPNDIIRNAVIRIQEQSALDTDSVTKQESEISKLATTLTPKKNTHFSWKWISKHTQHYQAHLERISDYLKCGKGVWWNETSSGVEFLDANGDYCPPSGPTVKHFRSTTTADVRLLLHNSWELCNTEGIPLPAKEIRVYGSDGALKMLRIEHMETENNDNLLERDSISPSCRGRRQSIRKYMYR